MKIKTVKSVGKLPVFDLTVDSECYDEQQYALENGVISHNTGIYYSANQIFIMGRQQEKQGQEVIGYNFIINVEKSRFVKEKSKIPISVTWDGGIDRYSGLLDVALAGGFVIKPSNGWYAAVDKSTGEEGKKHRIKDLGSDFWEPILSNPEFEKFLRHQYMVGYKAELSEDFIVEQS